MTDREAMKMALDAMLSEYSTGGENKYSPWDVIEALRQALAQPEQEPVAWGFSSKSGAIMDCISHEQHKILAGEYDVPLYTAPPKREWVGLTLRESSDLYNKNYDLYDTDMTIGDFIMIQREVEAKLKEKNGGS